MNEEFTQVDKLLDDERFFAPLLERYNTRNAQRKTDDGSVPYPRLMYLKCRYQLGYEIFVREVKDSFARRRFCHLFFSDRVPDSTTLIKLTHKYGEGTMRALNDVLVLKSKEGKVVRGKKLSIDTTLIALNQTEI